MSEREKLEAEKEIRYKAYMQILLTGSEEDVREASKRLDEVEAELKKLGDT